jgi:hypothetical protein
MGQAIILLLGYLFFSYNQDANFWHPKWMILHLLGVLVLCYQVYLIAPFASFLVAYALCGAMFIVSHEMIDHFTCEIGKKNHPCLTKVNDQIHDLLACVILFVFIPTDWYKLFLSGVPFLALLGAFKSFYPVQVDCLRMKKRTKFYGFGGNPSINSTLFSFLAIASLYNWNWLGLVGFIAATAACLKTGGSAGAGGLVFGILTILFIKFPVITLTSCIALGVAFPLWWELSKRFFPPYKNVDVLGYKVHPALGLSNRDHIFKFAYETVYKRYASWLFGVGFGVTAYAMPALQMLEKEKMLEKHKEVYPMLHSDLLQWFIDGGMVGVVLLLFAIIEAVFVGSVTGSPAFIGLIVCYLVNASANYPQKLAPENLIFIAMYKVIL